MMYVFFILSTLTPLALVKIFAIHKTTRYSFIKFAANPV